MGRVRLGVNIDHVATLREARKGSYPDPIRAAKICERSGADGIVCHLREDRRHIQERDIRFLLEKIQLPLNLEMSMNEDIVRIAKRLKVPKVTLVPEQRRELTTEGGLDVFSHREKVKRLVHAFEEKRIRVSLFIDPNGKQLEASWRTGVKTVEFHTGRYANAKSLSIAQRELGLIRRYCGEAKAIGLEVAAGHGLHYQNVRAVARIREIEELNIGHAIVSYAIFVGFAEAVREMKRLLS
ncbi:MAG: pyridoxine 5'-phosphate synthase [Candidatus Omnitrophica bacterium]|nr:pyridoxine 5'-phosphate synthase [Candidatus Omnitrophota bacterium]